MKKIITIATIIATSLIFTACGGGGGGSTAGTSAGSTSGSTAGTSGGSTATTGGSTDSQATSKVVPLTIGEPTEIQAGYSIVDSNDDAVLEILVSGETRTVILKSGVASVKMPI